MQHIDHYNTPVLFDLFDKNPWQADPIRPNPNNPHQANVGQLFTYIKPRCDRLKEFRFFRDLAHLHQFGLVVEISADDSMSEIEVISKLKKAGYPQLVSLCEG